MMTSDIAINPLQAQIIDSGCQVTSFHGKRFKALRIIGGTIQSFIMSLLYKIVSGLCFIVRKKDAHHKYSELSSFYLNRAMGRSLASMRFGSKIINFSTNFSGKVKERNQDGSNELQKLQKIYGDRFESMRIKPKSGDFPIDENRLSRLEMNEGVCLGASLDFISRFLKSYKDGEWFGHISKVSQLCQDAGTVEAQITQIFYEAQDIEKLHQGKSKEREQLTAGLNEQLVSIQENMNEE